MPASGRNLVLEDLPDLHEGERAGHSRLFPESPSKSAAGGAFFTLLGFRQINPSQEKQ